MLEPKQLPLLDDVNLETEDIPGLLEQIKDANALALVNQTFSVYETYRTQNHDPRYKGQDQLYTGWVQTTTWPGTNIAKSNLGYQITFDQVESAHPAITEALFGSNDWFEVEAFKGSNSQETQLIADHFRYLLTHARNEFGGSAMNELELAVKDVIYRGNGGICCEWDGVAKRPTISWVDVRDIYIDPALTVPNIDESRSAIRRKLITLQDLNKLKDVPGMNIPSEDYLFGLSGETPYVPGDTNKSVQEAFRGVNYTPLTSGYSPDPANRQLELLIYYDRERIIWVINRKHVAYNGTNPYGFIPLCFAPCYIYPGRFHAQSVIDALESIQLYIQALLNGRLNQVNLSLEPPRMMKRSTNMTPSNQAWHPNKIITVDDEKDYQLLQPQDILPNVFSDIEFLSVMAERRTGINGFGTGVPRPGNVNRTATGVSSQVQAGSLRLFPIVKNIENYMLLPMLYKLYHIIKVHTSAFENVLAKNPNGQISEIPASVFGAKINFRLNAASKMMTKEKLAQVFPIITQYLFNGPVMAELQTMGQKLNIEEYLRMLQDATGTGSLYQLIRPMTPEEQQAKQQQEQQAQQLQLQEKQQEHQVRLQVTRETNEKDLQIAQMKIQGDANPMLQEFEMAKEQQKMALEQQALASKIAADKELARIKIQAEREKAAQQNQQRQIEMLLNRQSKEQELQLKSAAAQNTFETQMVQNQMNLENNQAAAEQKLKINEQAAKQKELYKPRLNEKSTPAKPRKKAERKS